MPGETLQQAEFPRFNSGVLLRKAKAHATHFGAACRVENPETQTQRQRMGELATQIGVFKRTLPHTHDTARTAAA
jgi:hypothetical protein